MNAIDKLIESVVSQMDTDITEADSMTVKEFATAIEKAYKSAFPHGTFVYSVGKMFGITSLNMRTTLYDKDKWVNGIINNDPAYHVFNIDLGGQTQQNTQYLVRNEPQADGDSMELPAKLSVKAYQGGVVRRKSGGSVKVGWRNVTADPKGMIRHFVNYFSKMKKVVDDNKDNLSS
jgi:hypothetical protein